ncbi:MAG: hypothetical protein IPK10_00930 [Bacteroidetes bacterium]|nr:hypothetical protein [Bacteroidota bacterium]
MNTSLSNYKTLAIFLILILKNPSFSFGQYTLITLQCKENFDQCDTVSQEEFNKKDQIQYRLKHGEIKTSIEYIYNEKNILIKKIHRNDSHEITKYNLIYSDESGFWHTDSLIDPMGKLLYTFKRTPTDKPNNFMIEWFYKRDPNPSSRQIIQYDDQGKELSNSTCYTADNCVTYVFFYHQEHKIRSELWVMEGVDAQPILKETEDFVYSTENAHQPTSSIRFSEPDHTIIKRFKYVVLETSVQKKIISKQRHLQFFQLK